MQILLHSRQRKAHHHAAVAVVDHLAVGYLDMAETIVIQNHTGKHDEGNRHLHLFPMDNRLNPFLVSIIETDGHPAALSG